MRRKINRKSTRFLVVGLGLAGAVGLSGAALAGPAPQASATATQQRPSLAQTVMTVMSALQGNTNPLQANGQPNQSCGSPTAPNTPGNAVSASGSAFNPDGTAGTVYAGQQTQNSKNPVSVSQYDVACFNQPF